MRAPHSKVSLRLALLKNCQKYPKEGYLLRKARRRVVRKVTATFISNVLPATSGQERLAAAALDTETSHNHATFAPINQCARHRPDVINLEFTATSFTNFTNCTFNPLPDLSMPSD